VSRHFFLIAFLTVLLPGSAMATDHAMVPPPAFVTALRAMPGAGRAASRSLRKMVAARPVRGVYLVPARQPKSLRSPWANTALPERALWRAAGLRAPPTLA
jgi:hypothetical protein